MNDKELNTVNVAKSVKKKGNSKGASLVEYALLVALIAVLCIVAIRTIGQKVSQNFSVTRQHYIIFFRLVCRYI
jgi:Flp pilus assembly pilin Flp